MKLILPNENPDLDGAASTYAYSEFLKKQDEQATGAAFGDLTEETEEILEELDEALQDASYYLYSADEIIIVSASSMKNVSTRIPPEKVTQVIDHEELELEDFPNAEFIIEEDANSCSAIIARMFKENEFEITPQSAELLFQAISESNGETEILEWLEEQRN